MPSFLLVDYLHAPVWQWLIFMAVVILLMAFDLGILNRREREMSLATSLWQSLFYIACGCAFGAWVWWEHGATEPDWGPAWFTAYVVEKTLSMDNVFVMSVIFAYFGVPREYQHRVLFWGIIGVLLLRGIMIMAGATLIENFHWILYLFGAFLIYTGIKLLMAGDDDEPDVGKNPVVRFLSGHLRITPGFVGHKFLARQPDATGKLVLFATPLLVCLITIELADVVFALDSIPAVFAITKEAFVVYTSNIFAVLGLRALYFALAAMVHRFGALKYALSIVLILIGAKIFWNDFLAHKWNLVPEISGGMSLLLTVVVLGIGILLGILRPTQQKAD